MNGGRSVPFEAVESPGHLAVRTADGVSPNDVVLEKDLRFGVLDQLEHRGEGVGAVSQQTHAIGPRERTPGHLGRPGLEPGIERSYHDASSIRGAEEARPGPRTDVRTVRLAGRAQYAPLLEAGVRIYEWQPTTLHAKTFVADGVWAAKFVQAVTG